MNNKKGRPSGTGGIYKKREAYNKQQVSTSDNQTNYMRGLSTTVGKACDEWLAKRGMKNLSWKEQQSSEARKKAG
jgi:hypothetical protein